MPPSPSPKPSARVRRARIAVAAFFFTNGALFANILPRYPEIKEMFDLSNSVYGLTITMFPIGAMTAVLASGHLIRRFGSANVAGIGMVVAAAAYLLAGSSPHALLFGLMLFVAGGADAISDVGKNGQALVVQSAYGRSIINSFHAIWSIGSVVGGAMSALAIALGLPLSVHLSIVAAIFTAVALIARANTLPESEAVEHVADTRDVRTSMSRVSPKIILMLAALVLLAISGAAVEEVGNSWAALYLGESLGTPAQIAAFGYIALVGGQFIGRILGDRQVDRWGNRKVAIVGGMLTAAGMSAALAVPTVAGTLAGFALAGYGSATLIPSAFDRADKLPGLREGTGITLISWLLRIGYLGAPPLIGFIADSTSLRTGMLVLPAIGIIVILTAGILPNRSEGRAKSISAPAEQSDPETAQIR